MHDAHYKQKGWKHFRSALGPAALSALDAQKIGASTRLRPTDLPSQILALLSGSMHSVLPKSFPVRAALFSKSKTLSWSLDWHQDRVIAVKKRQVVEGFDNWTKKADIWHCEPPQNILENMFFTQLYLDDVSQSDGPVQFLEGSHLNGKLSQEQINAFPKEHSKICTAKRGDVYGAHGLLVHRSDQSISKKERRILRVDFCNVELPKPLEWAFR